MCREGKEGIQGRERVQHPGMGETNGSIPVHTSQKLRCPENERDKGE